LVVATWDPQNMFNEVRGLPTTGVITTGVHVQLGKAMLLRLRVCQSVCY